MTFDQMVAVLVFAGVMVLTFFWALKRKPTILDFAGILAFEIVFGLIVFAVYRYFSTGRL